MEERRTSDDLVYGLCGLQTSDEGRYYCRKHSARYAYHDCALCCSQLDEKKRPEMR